MCVVPVVFYIFLSCGVPAVCGTARVATRSLLLPRSAMCRGPLVTEQASRCIFECKQSVWLLEWRFISICCTQVGGDFELSDGIACKEENGPPASTLRYFTRLIVSVSRKGRFYKSPLQRELSTKIERDSNFFHTPLNRPDIADEIKLSLQESLETRTISDWIRQGN